MCRLKELTEGSVEQTDVDMLRREGVDAPSKHDNSEESEEQAAAAAVSSRVKAGLEEGDEEEGEDGGGRQGDGYHHVSVGVEGGQGAWRGRR